MPPTPYIRLGLILPAARDIMLTSDNKDCVNTALKVIKGREEVLRLTKHSSTKTNVSDYERFKYWIDIKNNVKTREFLPELATMIKQSLDNEGITCEVLSNQEA